MTKHKNYSPTCQMVLESELPKSKKISQKYSEEDQNLASDNGNNVVGQKRNNTQDMELPKNQQNSMEKGKNNVKRRSLIIPKLAKDQNLAGTNHDGIQKSNTQDLEVPKIQENPIEKEKPNVKIKLIIPKFSKDQNLARANHDDNVVVQKSPTKVPKNRQNLMKKVKNMAKLIIPKVSKNPNLANSANPDGSKDVAQKRNIQDFEVLSKNQQNPTEKDENNPKKRKSLIIPKVIIPKVSKDQILASTKLDNGIVDQKRNSQNLQKVQKNPQIGKEKSTNLEVFPCVLSQECHEKFQTAEQVENHGIKSHKDLGIGKKDINELLLGDYKSESDRLKTYAGM